MNALIRGWLVGACAMIAAGCAGQTQRTPARVATGDASQSEHASEHAGDTSAPGVQREARAPAVDQPGRYSPRIVAPDPDPFVMPDQSPETSGKPKAAAAGAGFQIPPPNAGGIHFKGPKGGDLLEPTDPSVPQPIEPPRTVP